MQPDLRSKIAELAAGRHGVVSVEEATALGCTRGQRRAAIARGEWSSPRPGVLVVAGSAPTWLRDCAVATLATGGVLSHRAAARLHELDGFADAAVELTVRGGAHWPESDAIVHRSSTLLARDITFSRGIRVTSIARTLVDLGAVVDDDAVEQALDDALRRGANARWIERTLDGVDVRGRTGAASLRRVLDRPDRSGPLPDSMFERLVERVCTDAGLPRPERQIRVEDRGRLVGIIDAGWPERRLGVEAHSARWHSGARRRRRDERRHNRLTALGWELLYATWADVEDSTEFAQLVRATYDNREPLK